MNYMFCFVFCRTQQFNKTVLCKRLLNKHRTSETLDHSQLFLSNYALGDQTSIFEEEKENLALSSIIVGN